MNTVPRREALRHRAYPGPPHVVERRHRDGSWIPVAVGIRATSALDALRKYRSCLPSGVWTSVKFRARLQEPPEFGALQMSR